MVMNYNQAQILKNKSTFSLMREKFAEGQSLTSSFKSARKLKKQARWTRIKEKFDPMMWSRKLFGKWGATLYGRSMGRSADDMHRFTGYRPHNIKTKKVKISQSDKNPKINPLYTKVGPGVVTPLRKNDSMADVVAKLYNFIKFAFIKDKKNKEIAHNFEKEFQGQSDKRHSELIEIIKSTYTKVGKSGEDSEEPEGKGIGRRIAGWLVSLGATIIAVITTVVSVLTSIASSIIKSLGKFLIITAINLVTYLSKKVLGVLGQVLTWVATKVWKVLAPTLESLIPIVRTLLPQLLIPMLAAYGIKKGLDLWVESAGGPETIRKMIELDKKGVIENNLTLGYGESKVLDFSKISKADASLLVKSNDFSGETQRQLAKIANPEGAENHFMGMNDVKEPDEPPKVTQETANPPTDTYTQQTQPMVFPETTGYVPTYTQQTQPMVFPETTGYVPTYTKAGTQPVEYTTSEQTTPEQTTTSAPAQVDYSLINEDPSGLHSASKDFLSTGFSIKPSQETVVYNNSSQSSNQSSSTPQWFSGIGIRNTDTTLNKLQELNWKPKNGT